MLARILECYHPTVAGGSGMRVGRQVKRIGEAGRWLVPEMDRQKLVKDKAGLP